MNRLGIIANLVKSRAPDVLQRLDRAAADGGLELLCEEEAGGYMPSATVVSQADLVSQAEAMMVLGGDGTMLKGVRTLAGRECPVIGVNIGSLGFLTSVAEEDLERALACLVSGEFSVRERSLVCCELKRNGKLLGEYNALNDVVIQSGSPRVVALSVAIDGEPVTDYICDGLIIATPTGSTGHSLSASGPIVHPAAPAFIISLICPHTLSSRPLVVSDTGRIEVTVTECAGEMSLTVDGQVGQGMVLGDRVEVSRSPQTVSFIHLPGYSYFAVLRQKLGWRGSSVG